MMSPINREYRELGAKRSKAYCHIGGLYREARACMDEIVDAALQ
jgi:hypothetical protein